MAGFVAVVRIKICPAGVRGFESHPPHYGKKSFSYHLFNSIFDFEEWSRFTIGSKISVQNIGVTT